MPYGLYQVSGPEVSRINEIMFAKNKKNKDKGFVLERSHEDERNGDWIEEYMIDKVDVSFVYSRSASNLRIYIFSTNEYIKNEVKSRLEEIIGVKLD